MREQPTTKIEEGPKQEEFDKFLVPEEWPEDVVEAQKDAYRMKVLAYSEKALAESKLASALSPFAFKPREKKPGAEPLAEDYKSAEDTYHQVYGPFPADNKIDQAINKMLELTGGTLLKAYVELRARMLAISESKKLKEEKEKN